MKINAIDMVRKIRDENFLKTNDLSKKDKIEATKKLAQIFTKNHDLKNKLKIKSDRGELAKPCS